MAMQRPRFSRFSRTDWHGDSMIVIVLGVFLLGSLLLPWAGIPEDRGDDFNYSLTSSDGLKSILATEWGAPIAVAGVVVALLGGIMLTFGPRRWTGGPLSLLLVAAALFVLYQVGQVAESIWSWGYVAGLGLMLALIVGIVLPIVALASAMTSRILRGLEAAEAAAAAATAEAAVQPETS